MPTGTFYCCDNCNHTDKYIDSKSREFMKKSWIVVETQKIEYGDTLIKKIYCSPTCASVAFSEGVFPDDNIIENDWMDEEKD